MSVDSLFWWSGALVWCVVAVFALALICHIAGNIYGGIKGALRLYRVREQKLNWRRVKLVTKLGVYSWIGKRYRNGTGHFWRVDGMIVPCDGRDPIEPDRY